MYVCIYTNTVGRDYGRVCQTINGDRKPVRGLPERTAKVQAELRHSRHYIHFIVLHRAVCVGLEEQLDDRQGDINGKTTDTYILHKLECSF